MQEQFLSFIKPSPLTILPSEVELCQKLEECKTTGIRRLENLDLSQVNFGGKPFDFSNLELVNIVFSWFDTDKGDRKPIRNCDFSGCSMRGVSFRQARIEQCDFGKNADTGAESRLEGVDFFYSCLSSCRFRHAKMVRVDFRYSKVEDCSMGNVEVKYGDFYKTCFLGSTNFYGSLLESCSLTEASFENAIPEFPCIKMLAQESVEEYDSFLEAEGEAQWHRLTPVNSVDLMNETTDPQERRVALLREASHDWRVLSGMYAGKGCHGYSNRAYSRCIRLRARAARCELIKSRKAIASLAKNYLILLLGCGYHFIPPLVLLLIFMVLKNWNCQDTNLFIEIPLTLAAGYFGFVIANKIRSNA